MPFTVCSTIKVAVPAFIGSAISSIRAQTVSPIHDYDLNGNFNDTLTVPRVNGKALHVYPTSSNSVKNMGDTSFIKSGNAVVVRLGGSVLMKEYMPGCPDSL